MDTLAQFRGPTDRLRQVIFETSLTVDPGDPFYGLIRLSLSGDALESTTPTGWTGPAFETRYESEYFDAFDGPDEPCLAALGTAATLQWLDWVDGGETTVRFLGDADDYVAHAVELESDADRVEVGPLPSDGVEANLATGRPEAFEDGRFVHDGSKAPTRVETTGETLERLADAAAIVDDSGVPVVVEDGDFRLAVSGDLMHGRGVLPGAVSGPDCTNRYGDGLAAVARALSGPVTLQVVPSGPLAAVQDTDEAVRRYALTQTM